MDSWPRGVVSGPHELEPSPNDPSDFTPSPMIHKSQQNHMRSAPMVSEALNERQIEFDRGG